MGHGTEKLRERQALGTKPGAWRVQAPLWSCASWAEPIADSSPIGLLSRDLSQSYKCVDCDETPEKGQYFHLVETNETAMVQREFLADCFAC